MTTSSSNLMEGSNVKKKEPSDACFGINYTSNGVRLRHLKAYTFRAVDMQLDPETEGKPIEKR